MNQIKNKDGKGRTQYTLNLALAAVASQVGCVTIIIIAAALLGGLWLDNHFDSKPVFLAITLIASVPITVFLMLWIVRSITSRIKPPENGVENRQEEYANRGKNER